MSAPTVAGDFARFESSSIVLAVSSTAMGSMGCCAGRIGALSLEAEIKRISKNKAMKAPTKMAILIGSMARVQLCRALNGNGVNHHFLDRPVLGPALHLGNFIDDILSFHDFTKDGVIAGKPRRGC